MGFVPIVTVGHAPWDANTTEQQNVFALAGTWSYVAPAGCTYVVFSRGSTGAVACWITSDAVDVDSGIRWNNNVGNPRIGLHVLPGSTIIVRADAATTVNATEFYNTPG